MRKKRRLFTYDVYGDRELIGWRKMKKQAIQFVSVLLNQYDCVEIRRRARRLNDFNY